MTVEAASEEIGASIFRGFGDEWSGSVTFEGGSRGKKEEYEENLYWLLHPM